MSGGRSGLEGLLAIAQHRERLARAQTARFGLLGGADPIAVALLVRLCETVKKCARPGILRQQSFQFRGKPRDMFAFFEHVRLVPVKNQQAIKTAMPASC